MQAISLPGVYIHTWEPLPQELPMDFRWFHPRFCFCCDSSKENGLHWLAGCDDFLANLLEFGCNNTLALPLGSPPRKRVKVSTGRYFSSLVFSAEIYRNPNTFLSWSLWILKFPAAWSCFKAAFKGRWSQNQYHDIYIYTHILVRKSGHSRQLLQSRDESKFSQEAGQGGSRMRGWQKSDQPVEVYSLGWFRSLVQYLWGHCGCILCASLCFACINQLWFCNGEVSWKPRCFVMWLC